MSAQPKVGGRRRRRPEDQEEKNPRESLSSSGKLNGTGGNPFNNSGKLGGTRRTKAAVVVSLYVNHVEYEFGKLCEFCTEKVATAHCPETRCGFVCDDCDKYRHENANNKAYQAHVRTKVSAHSIITAGETIQWFMRWMHERSKLRQMCREQYTRLYTHRAKRHFYVFNRTGETSWFKPRTLGREELKPFLTETQAAFKIQQLYRNWQAREVARSLMRQYWDRIYSPFHQRFYYYYTGKSPLIIDSRTRWIQPCRTIGREWVWRPIVTMDMAALRIQNCWRTYKGRVFIRQLVRQVYVLDHDAITGTPMYRHVVSGETRQTKPKLLGSERWDMGDMMEWTTEEVIIFLRRIGMKKYVDAFRFHGIDGALFLTLDPPDFVILNVKHTIHVKRILICIERRPQFVGYNSAPKDLQRRLLLRQWHLRQLHAIKIQRWWKIKYKERLKRSVANATRILRRDVEAAKLRDLDKIWWTERGDGYNYTGPKIGTKDYGPRAVRRAVYGWGQFTPKGKFIPAPPSYNPDLHASRKLYKIVQNGNENNRLTEIRPLRPVQEYQIAEQNEQRRQIQLLMHMNKPVVP